MNWIVNADFPTPARTWVKQCWIAEKVAARTTTPDDHKLVLPEKLSLVVCPL